MIEQIIRGPLLVPRDDGRVDFVRDGALAADAAGIIRFAGEWRVLAGEIGADPFSANPKKGSAPFSHRMSDGIMLPPLIDLHTHIPQHPVRGKFTQGIPADPHGGTLLLGLEKNVFPREAQCADPEYAQIVVDTFAGDTLAHGVVGGAAYMTTSALATQIALQTLSPLWQVGLVLMNQNCPAYIHTNMSTIASDLRRLGRAFGHRLIVTDRFAVAVDTPLRKIGVAAAKELGLRTQTHLNEQVGEKKKVEHELYRAYRSYTDVYLQDGLLNHQCICAHCVHMYPEEWAILRDSGSIVAHCPTSNSLLGSGTMALDELLSHQIPFAIATDVGASPTVSMLAEIARFLAVHANRSENATPSEGLYRATLAPAKILGLDPQVGRLVAGAPLSFIEVQASRDLSSAATADDAIRAILPANLDDPPRTVRRATLDGRAVFTAEAANA